MKVLCTTLSLLLASSCLALLVQQTHVAGLQTAAARLKNQLLASRQEVEDLAEKLKESNAIRDELGKALNSNAASYEQELIDAAIATERWKSNYYSLAEQKSEQRARIDFASRSLLDTLEEDELRRSAAAEERHKADTLKAIQRLARAQESNAFEVRAQRLESQMTPPLRLPELQLLPTPVRIVP